MNSFYITIPSDSSMDIYPKNTQCCFKVKLPQKIQLEKESWDVALVELIVPSQIGNIRREDGYFDIVARDKVFINRVLAISIRSFEIHKHTSNDSSENVEEYRFRFQIPPGSYMTPEHLVETINDCIQLNFGDIFAKRDQIFEIRYSSGGQRPKMQFKYVKQIGLELSPKMHLMLGGNDDKNRVIYPNSSNMFPYKSNMNIGSNQLYLYSDIVEYSIVGNIQAPILRVVPFTTVSISDNQNANQHIHQEYLNLHYLPIAKSEFENIGIDIRGDTGDSVHFIGGKSMVKLHFRKRNK